MAVPFRLYNTLSRSIEAFTPIDEGKIRLYVCGMTVYDHCHIGHARAMVVFDAFVRYLRHRDWNVTFVRNFTDVDDKIIVRSAETGEEPLALAQRYIDAFHEDVDNLGLIRPDKEPRVSTSIADIQALITKLVERGHAYANEGTVWFGVDSFDEYGKLSGQKVKELRSPDEVPGKRNPADFALWKAVKPGEPSWDSPWGEGRPGWHIECSAMASACLGETIDIHGGGLDLVFPHHENEVAQSECGHGAQFTRYWMHNGLLTMTSGQKMGKSLGNVINIRDALAAFPAESLRLYYLQNLYRSSLPWSDTALPDALGMLARLYEARDVAEMMGGYETAEVAAERLGADALRVLELGRSFKQRFYGALDDDFNTAQALGYTFELARAINRFGNHKKARKSGGPVVAPALKALMNVTSALSLLGMDNASFQEEVKAKRLSAMGTSREEVEQKIAERMTARDDRDWARADALRDELSAMQILVMDTAAGCDWRVRLSAPDAD
jgi:cysteinyl-tRNA synthetase